MVNNPLRTAVWALTAGVSASVGWDFYNQNERAHRRLIMPLVHTLLDGENAHNLAVWMAKNKVFPRSSHKVGGALAGVKLWDLSFPNPVGLAAGFDKDAECIAGMEKVGFGFIEVGSVTPAPQPGNDKPRVFRLAEDQGVINRYGFNSQGHDAVELNVRMHRAQHPERAIVRALSNAADEQPCVLGINLGKNKTSPSAVQDYSAGVRKFAALADYLVVNISSPNTPGLRDLQAKKELEELVSAVVQVRDQACLEQQLGRTVPLLIKIAPDLSEEDKKDIAQVVARHKVDGLVVSNTTVSRPDSLQNYDRVEKGGLSGAPLREMSTKVISDMYSLTNGEIPIVGVGGIASGQDALDKIKAGASVVQVYSALTYHGMPLVKRIQRELEILLAKEGYSHVSEAVGANHRNKASGGKRGFFF